MDSRGMLSQALTIVGIALVAGTVANLTASPKRQLSWVGTTVVAAPEVPTVDAAEPAVDGEDGTVDPTEISTERAHAEWAAGALFLDARASQWYYDEGRIPNARSFAVWEGDIDDKIVTLLSEFTPEQRMVIYCTGGDCEDSHLLRNKLLSAGYTDLLVYKDGFPGWTEAGHPVEH